MSRCQRRIVSGVTSSRRPLAARFGYHAEQGREQCPVRPVQVRAARLLPLQHGELMVQDQDLCGLHASSRRDSRSHAASRVIRRKTNRRRMIGDHHTGRLAGQLCWSEPWTGFSARTGPRLIADQGTGQGSSGARNGTGSGIVISVQVTRGATRGSLSPCHQRSGQDRREKPKAL